MRSFCIPTTGIRPQNSLSLKVQHESEKSIDRTLFCPKTHPKPYGKAPIAATAPPMMTIGGRTSRPILQRNRTLAAQARAHTFIYAKKCALLKWARRWGHVGWDGNWMAARLSHTLKSGAGLSAPGYSTSTPKAEKHSHAARLRNVQDCVRHRRHDVV
jgi:hypothetical protein